MALLLTLLLGSRADSKVSGNSKITSWTSQVKVSNHTTYRIYKPALNCNWITNSIQPFQESKYVLNYFCEIGTYEK